MERVDSDTIVAQIDQLRVNRGWPKQRLSEAMQRSRGFWATMVASHRGRLGPQATIHMINDALKPFGMCLYIGPLPKEENDAHVAGSDGH